MKSLREPRPASGILALLGSNFVTFAPVSRRVWAFLTLSICLAAVTLYVVMVNVAMFTGDHLGKNLKALQNIERELDTLQHQVSAQQSPSWLEDRSRSFGMVEAFPRYLNREGQPTLSQR